MSEGILNLNYWETLDKVYSYEEYISNIQNILDEKTWSHCKEMENSEEIICYPDYIKHNYIHVFFEKGKYINEAKEIVRIHEIEEERKEYSFWRKVNKENIAKLYLEYIETYPSGKYIKEAKSFYTKELAIENELKNLIEWAKNNKISEEEMPRNIISLKNLIKLEIPYKKVSILPKEIGSLGKLTELSIRTNEITSLPKEIGNLKNLIYLRIESNCLRTLPDSIGNLKNLTFLSIFNACLTELPKNIGNLEKLTTLFLCSAFIKTIPKPTNRTLPKEIGNLKNLTTIDIRDNQLTSLPREFGNLIHIDYISCDGNLFKSLPKEMNNLKLDVQKELKRELPMFKKKFG